MNDRVENDTIYGNVVYCYGWSNQSIFKLFTYSIWANDLSTSALLTSSNFQLSRCYVWISISFDITTKLINIPRRRQECPCGNTKSEHTRDQRMESLDNCPNLNTADVDIGILKRNSVRVSTRSFFKKKGLEKVFCKWLLRKKNPNGRKMEKKSILIASIRSTWKLPWYPPNHIP